MKIIGLCGSSGSGKGTVAEILAEHGVRCIDTDAVYREITSYPSQCLAELSRVFGDGILNADGSLNRQALAKTALATDENAKKLNSVTHKYVISECRRIIEAYRASDIGFVAIDAPMLFESGLDKDCDITIAVVCDRETEIERIIHRDGIDRNTAELRLSRQKSNDFYYENCNIVIDNSGSLDSLRKETERVFSEICVLAAGSFTN